LRALDRADAACVLDPLEVETGVPGVAQDRVGALETWMFEHRDLESLGAFGIVFDPIAEVGFNARDAAAEHGILEVLHQWERARLGC
jgi:hypothetical protein